MVLPLIPLAIIGAGGLTAVGAYFGLSGQEPDVQTTNQYSTTNQYQTKKTALTLGEGAKIGSLTFKDSMSQSATVEQQAKQEGDTSSLLSNPLVLAAGAVGVAYFLTKR